MIFNHYVPIGPCSPAALHIASYEVDAIGWFFFLINAVQYHLPERQLHLNVWLVNDQDLGTKLHEMWAKIKLLRLCIYSHVFRAAVYILCVYYTDMNDV